MSSFTTMMDEPLPNEIASSGTDEGVRTAAMTVWSGSAA